MVSKTSVCESRPIAKKRNGKLRRSTRVRRSTRTADFVDPFLGETKSQRTAKYQEKITRVPVVTVTQSGATRDTRSVGPAPPVTYEYNVYYVLKREIIYDSDASETSESGVPE